MMKVRLEGPVLRQCCQHSRHWHSRHWCCSVENTHDTDIPSWFRQRLRDYNSPFFCSELQSVSRIVKIVHSAVRFFKNHHFCPNLKNHQFLPNFEKSSFFDEIWKNHQFWPKFEKSSFFAKICFLDKIWKITIFGRNFKKSSIFAKIWKIIIFGRHLREKVDLFTTVVCCIHYHIHCWMLFVECWIQTVVTMLQQWEVYPALNAQSNKETEMQTTAQPYI